MTVDLVLYQPDIAQNTGTLLRLCACVGVAAHIIEPAGFAASDRTFRRAGLDYLDLVTIHRHDSFAAFLGWARREDRRLVLVETDGADAYHAFCYEPRDMLILGRESAGVAQEVVAACGKSVRIDMRPGLRSINVALAGAMVLGEALRQTRGFPIVSQGEVL